MCGIVGYVGKRDALPILLQGIKNLEYRGYDSAGLAVVSAGHAHMAKSVGKVAELEKKIGSAPITGTMGIVHSRWATHGGVTEANAHPHTDCTGEIFLVHNGIVENYRALKEQLLARGHTFVSETDTEVLAHLIEEERKTGKTLEEAVRSALGKVRGTYGLAIFDVREPQTLVAARNSSPLILGLGDHEYFIASDASPILRHTREVLYLEDGELAVLTPEGYRVTTLDARDVSRKSDTISWTAEEAEKGGYAHFMLKEIFEQPEAIENALRGRMITDAGKAKLGGLEAVHDALKHAERILIVACGTAHFAGRVGEYMIEEYAGIPAEVDVASEFRYRKPVFRKGDVALFISQSGETADTLAALREAKQKGVLTLGIVNVVGSTLARETDAGVYQHAGPEIGVASTKAFTSQVSILALLTLMLGRDREMSMTMGKRIVSALRELPDAMRKVLTTSDAIRELAVKYQPYQNFLYLGRKYQYPVALEGALKLKEISYAHAEGISAGEMKHGSIAMIDKNFPSVIVALRDSVYEKNISSIQEIKARGGPVIAIATEGDKEIRTLADDVIYIPKVLEMLAPILAVIPLQLFAYYFAAQKGLDVDRPRNLAKSVTVE